MQIAGRQYGNRWQETSVLTTGYFFEAIFNNCFIADTHLVWYSNRKGFPADIRLVCDGNRKDNNGHIVQLISIHIEQEELVMAMHTVIYERRRAMGLTQEQVAEYLGVSAPAVHKWEKGVTYPDITLIPKLTRLLKTDLNTLFCYKETMTLQEVQQFQEEVGRQIRTGGIDTGFSMAKEKIQEYPDCAALLEGMAMLMQGCLLMENIPESERNKYQPQITAWYARAMDCGDAQIKNRAGYMTAFQYIQSGELKKAKQILQVLPEPDMFNKHVLLADVSMKQGDMEEALKMLQKVLLQMAQSLMGVLCRLTDLELAADKIENAKQIAGKAKEVAQALDMWGYTGLSGLVSVAHKTKNVQETLRLFNQMLEEAVQPFRMQDSVLYSSIYEKMAEETRMSDKLLPLLLSMLESDPTYDFLRNEKEFDRLLEKYRRYIDR